MGALLKTAQSQNPDKTIINELKSKIMIEPLIDIVSKIEEQIGEEGLYITKELYQESFRKPINNTFLLDNLFMLLLDYWKPESTSILKFELYILMILLSKGSFEAKTNFLFNIFCINDEMTLISQDIILLIKTALYSIFKICKMKVPNDSEIKDFLLKNFPLIFMDDYFELPFEDFSDWIRKNNEVHGFLIEFFDIQTKENAMKEFLKYFVEFQHIFDVNIIKETISNHKLTKNKFFISLEEDPVNSELMKRSPVNKLMDSLGNILQKIDPRSLEIFIELIDPDHTSFARKDRYLNVVKAVCVFMAVDKDMSHSLSQSELGTLLWLLSGDEPNDEKLSNTIKVMDANGDCAIELGEWLEYIATKDSKGRRTINYELKKRFDKYDMDGNGTISIDELEKMFIDSFAEIISKTNDKTKKYSESLVLDLAKIIMKEMDIDSSNALDWMEFKFYLQVANGMEEKIASYIQKYLVIDNNTKK